MMSRILLFFSLAICFLPLFIVSVMVVEDSHGNEPAPSYDYSIEFHGADVPDLRSCKVIHWEPLTEPDSGKGNSPEFGYAFLYDIMRENGIEASLTTDGLFMFEYGRKFDRVLKYLPERFEANIAEICSALGADNESRTYDEYLALGGLYGGFDESMAGQQARLAIRGFVHERTYRGAGTVRMTVERVYENRLCSYVKAFGVHWSRVVVERVYAFYNYEGVRFATVKVQAPHRILQYSFDAEINAARKAVDLAIKEFLKGDKRKRLIRGQIKGSQDLLGTVPGMVEAEVGC